jgi:heme/copper-type cytochrome/quinol oxidase subunit 2
VAKLLNHAFQATAHDPDQGSQSMAMLARAAGMKARLMMSDLEKAARWASLALSGIANGKSKFELQTPQTSVAHVFDDLHSIALGICILVAVVVFGFMFYATVRHRRSLGHQAKQFDDNLPVQILWTLIPCVIVVAMAFPATRAVIAMKDTSSPDMTIKITSYQWKWHHDYIGQAMQDFKTRRQMQDDTNAPAYLGRSKLVNNPRERTRAALMSGASDFAGSTTAAA